MKFSKLCFMLATATFAVGAFADAADVLISFSTKADYYADGTPVLDGEWYALCWTADGSFDGLNVDCTPVDPNERVLILAPLAKGGRCPDVVFQVNSKKAPSGGNYFVYVLDTRATADSMPAKAVKENGRSVPENAMNGSQVATKGFTASAGASRKKGRTVSEDEKVDSLTVAWSAVTPQISAFAVDGDDVTITVTGMLPGISYMVKMGESPESLSANELTITEGTGTVDFHLKAGDARFFSVVGE